MDNEDESKIVGVSLNDHLKESELLGPKVADKLVNDEIKRIHTPGSGSVSTSSQNPYGILLMEEMQELEWLYCLKEGRKWSAKRPKFYWTGKLRPHRVSPMLTVPSHIARPDYADDGYPESEVESEQQNSIPVRTKEEIEGIRAACRVGRQVLDAATKQVKSGVTTDELDRVVHETCVELGAYPSPLMYYNFPKSVCASVNECVCHGIPDRRELEDGDLVNLDVTVYYNGFHGDLNETHCVGKVTEQNKSLAKTTYDCLFKAIEIVRPGVKFRDLGRPITKHAQANGFSVVRDYCGHGIGDLFHCAPTIPHYKGNKTLGVMKAGMTFTIEPMLNVGSHHCVTWPDGWTSVTKDGKRSAQYEHTLLVTEAGCEILTARTPTSTPLWWEKEEEQTT